MHVHQDRHGIVQVYTGTGKGKTTAAWGLALRAVGHGHAVAVVQFLKPSSSGEVRAAERFEDQLSVFGETRPYDPGLDQRGSDELRVDSRRNLDTAREAMLSGRYDLVVLDEINMVLWYEFVSRDEMLRFLAARPNGVELVLTGRYAPDWLISAADLVTEMTAVKHTSDTGMKARKGIEY